MTIRLEGKNDVISGLPTGIDQRVIGAMPQGLRAGPVPRLLFVATLALVGLDSYRAI